MKNPGKTESVLDIRVIFSCRRSLHGYRINYQKRKMLKKYLVILCNFFKITPIHFEMEGAAIYLPRRVLITPNFITRVLVNRIALA